MAPVRNLRRLVVGLAFGLALLGLSGAVLWLRSFHRPGMVAQPKGGESLEPAKKREIRFLNEQPAPLEPGRPVAGELKGGQGYRYAFSLEAGQIAQIVVAQQGVDVAVEYLRPGRDTPVEVDSPNWRLGREIVYELAEVPHTYALNVVCEDFTAPPGRYEIRLETLRMATAEDRTRFDAWKAFQNGERRSKRGELGEALSKYEESLALWRQVKDRSWEADALGRIGWMRKQLEQNREALEPLRQALAMFREESGRQIDEALAFNRLGETLYRLNDWDASVEAHEASLPLFRDLGMAWMEASAHTGIGNARMAQGRVQEAQESFRQALERARTMQSRESIREEALALQAMGDLLSYQDRRQEARDHLRQGMGAADRAGATEVKAAILSLLAHLDRRDKRFQEADVKLEQALAIQQAAGNRRGEAAIWTSLGTVRLLAGETEGAGEAYRRALAFYRDLRDPLREGFGLLNLGRYFHAKGEAREALACHERAAELFRATSSRRGEVSTLFGSARALRDLGEFGAARERLKKILEDVEILRAESEIPDRRASYLATRQHYFDLYVDVLMHLHEKDPASPERWQEKALEIDERRRARSLLDLLVQAGAESGMPADSPALRQERDLQQQINALEEEISETEEREEGSHRLADLEERQRALLGNLEEVRQEILRQNPESAALLRPEPLGLTQIRTEILDKGTALLVFSLGEDRSFLWYVPHAGEVSVHILPPRKVIEEAARTIHDGWSRSGRGSLRGAEQMAVRLSRYLLEKVAPRLTARRLVIIGDGALEYVPFAALPDPRTLTPEGGPQGKKAPPRLLENHEIVYLPSVSVLSVLRKKERSVPFMAKRIGVIADPVFGPDDPRFPHAPKVVRPSPNPEGAGGSLQRAATDLGISRFPRLPFTAHEADVIRELVPKELRVEALGFAANPDTAKGKDLAACRVLHFATHGLLNSRHPELSGLLLSRVDEQGNLRKDGGFLLAHEIRNLKFTAELAVLSACETGLGEEVRGEGLVGLTRSFMYAGVPRLVVSLWKVEDQGTSELMRRFYRILLTRDHSPSEALRCAQLSMSKDPRWSSPADWAAFVFQGEWRWPRRQRTSGDDGVIETPVGAVGPGYHPEDDLPPPVMGGPRACPDDIDF
jgi:CHAT domain-containing protein/Tfp pilus assembly protein PilF